MTRCTQPGCCSRPPACAAGRSPDSVGPTWIWTPAACHRAGHGWWSTMRSSSPSRRRPRAAARLPWTRPPWPPASGAAGGRPKWQDSGPVFTWPDGRPIHPERFSRWFEQHARAAGLPKIRLHDVRHSYATAALAAGVPAKVVSERLGHANIAITMDTYSHVLPGLDAEAADTVARLILGDGDQEPARPIDKALTTDRPTSSRREAVKREAPGQEGVRAGGFEPPRVAPPGPKPGASAGSATLAN